MQRRNGNVTLIHRSEVGVWPGIAFISRRADPVQGIAARILLGNNLIGRMATAAARHADPFDLVQREIRHVNIEDTSGTQRLAAKRTENRAGYRGGSVIVGVAV